MGTFLTVPEVAELTTLSVQQVYRLVQLKRIPHTRIGNRVFCSREALDKWIAENSFPAVVS